MLLNILEEFCVLGLAGNQKDSGIMLADCVCYEHLLLADIVVGTGNVQGIITALGFHKNPLQKLVVAEIFQIWKNCAELPGSLAFQISCLRVGDIVQFFDRVLDTCPGFRIQIVGSIDTIGDSCDGNACPRSYIFLCCHVNSSVHEIGSQFFLS